MAQLQIFVKLLNEASYTFSIDIQADESILVLKKKIYDKVHISPASQLLAFKSKLLKPSNVKISACGIRNFDTILCSVDRKLYIQPSMTNTNSSTKTPLKYHYLRVHLRNNNICDLKTKIELKEGIDQKRQVLMCSDGEIVDDPLHSKSLLKCITEYHVVPMRINRGTCMLKYSIGAGRLHTTPIFLHEFAGINANNQHLIEDDDIEDTFLDDIDDKIYLDSKPRFETQLLIFGYIHDSISCELIPDDILNLCHQFYHQCVFLDLRQCKA